MTHQTATEPVKRPSPIATFSGPKLLICEGKYDTSYYFIPNEAVLHAVALRLLNERLENGYLPKEKDYAKGEESLQKLQEELPRIEALEGESIRRSAKKEWEHRMTSLKEDLKVLREAQRIRTALDDNDGGLAWMILLDRRTAEYENVELQSVENMGGGPADTLPRPENPRHGRLWTDPEGKRWVYDAKTIQDWIPHIYGAILYDVKAFQGEDVTRLPSTELHAYQKAAV